jgi:hypothetical protein
MASPWRSFVSRATSRDGVRSYDTCRPEPCRNKKRPRFVTGPVREEQFPRIDTWTVNMACLLAGGAPCEDSYAAQIWSLDPA